MQASLCVSTSLLLAAAVAAQTPTNRIGYDVGFSDYHSRSGVPATSAGDILHQVDGSTLVGVGTSAGDSVSGLRVVVHDEDQSTQDPYNVVVYPADASGGPQLGGETRTGDLRLPVGTGSGTHLVTVTFTTPLAVPATDYFYGVGISVATGWPADGLSVHGGNYNQTPDVTNPNAPGVTWSVDTSAGAVANAAQPRLHRMDMLTEAVTLSPGADVVGSGVLFGLRGHWADRTADDGVAFRVLDAANPGVDYAILGQVFGANPSPISMTGFVGDIYLNQSLFFPVPLASGTLDANGEDTVVAIPAPLTLPAPFTQVSAQAIVDLGQVNGQPRLSNLAVIQDS